MISNTTEALHGVWGSSADDVFAVGDGGTAIDYDGHLDNEWSILDTSISTPLYDVWGSSAEDVFASGSIFHWDGSAFSEMDSSSLSDLLGVWGTSGIDVFAVGADGTIVHFGEEPPPPPTVTTEAVSDIGSTTATGNGTITDTGGENCIARGVCWSTSPAPDVDDSKSSFTGSFSTGPFTASMTGLSPNETYYVRAYALNFGGYGYGDEVSFTTDPLYDWGDAPDPDYPTLLASRRRASRHRPDAVPGLHHRPEDDGQPNASATGDDTDLDGDDGDGVAFTSAYAPGEDMTLEVTASQQGYLDAWVDFNSDGDWTDEGEQVFTSELLAAGVNSLSIPVPGDASAESSTFARFRFSSAGGLSCTGEAEDGEVEDYELSSQETIELSLKTGWNMVSVP